MTCNGYCTNFNGLNEDETEFWCDGYHRWLIEGKEDPKTCPENPDNQK